MGEGGQQIMGGKEEREEDDGKEREVGTKRRVRSGHKVSYSIHTLRLEDWTAHVDYP
jgi:hypothetical protein